jgi:hypothetical protein
MSKAEYTPRATSLAGKVIDYLEGNPGAKLTRDDIGKRFATNPKTVAALMRPAVDAGLVRTEKEGNANVYCALEDAPPQEPGDGKLNITTYADGDVGIGGLIVAEDGSVLITREQLQQLFSHVTTPHVVFTMPTQAVPGALASTAAQE